MTTEGSLIEAHKAAGGFRRRRCETSEEVLQQLPRGVVVAIVDERRFGGGTVLVTLALGDHRVTGGLIANDDGARVVRRVKRIQAFHDLRFDVGSMCPERASASVSRLIAAVDGSGASRLGVIQL
jgi:hypothetical protein